LVLADNQYAYSTPTSRQFACDDLADKAAGYGVESHSVDGTDLASCLQAVGAAVARARAGHGPQLVVAKLLRLCGHGEHDDSNYIDPQLKNSPLGRDCLKVAEEFLFREKMLDAATLATWRSEIIHEIEDAVATAQREPAPDPFTEDWRALASENLVETHLENAAR
jgi:acetoin:2,6-dichlorophenolindophenol oxidoreductase subunit alpha